jgi:hypothetical protein
MAPIVHHFYEATEDLAIFLDGNPMLRFFTTSVCRTLIAGAHSESRMTSQSPERRRTGAATGPAEAGFAP